MRSINLIVIHCSATTESQDIGRKEIDQWHKQRGWNGIGYHWVIRRDGTVEQGRSEAQPGSHTQGRNKNSIGVCMIGGVRRQGDKLIPEDNFTPAQWASLKRLTLQLLNRYPNADVRGHRDFANKACPSFSVADWIKREQIPVQRLTSWETSGRSEPKPLTQSKSVQGAAVAGVAGTAAVGDAFMESADAAKDLTFLAEPGSILALVLLVIIIGGTIYSIWGRKRIRDEEGI